MNNQINTRPTLSEYASTMQSYNKNAFTAQKTQILLRIPPKQSSYRSLMSVGWFVQSKYSEVVVDFMELFEFKEWHTMSKHDLVQKHTCQ